jgi:hypothetical protein
MKQYLKETKLLNYSHPSISALTSKWAELDNFKKIKAAYNFTRDSISFGYNQADNIPASQVLKDGYGQCNTKGILLMALLRSLGIPCRFHGFTINKQLQKGAISGIWYSLAPKEIIHSWVEVYFEDQWLNLEGFILDRNYLAKLQSKFFYINGSFCGYGVATKEFKNPAIDWQGNDTYIQKEGINQDFGTFNDPDSFFADHQQALKGIKKWLFENKVRKSMNRNVMKIRNGNPQI